MNYYTNKNNKLTLVLCGIVVFLLLSACFTKNETPEFADQAATVTLNKTTPGCLSCHGHIENIHPNIEIACTDCHGGDYTATDKAQAHVPSTGEFVYDDSVPPLDKDLAYQQFVNPSNLRVADKTCGKCHQPHVDNVKKSLMANTAGHHSGGLYQSGIDVSKTPRFGTLAVSDDDGEVPTEKGAISSLLDLVSWDNNLDTHDESNPVMLEYATHFKAVPEQACVRCHLWTRGKGFRGAVDDLPKHKQDSRDGLFRADGCAACHMVYANDGLSQSADTAINHQQKGHPKQHRLTRFIPSEQCIHCHHRGARIGLSFTGRSQMPPDLPSGPDVPGTTDERFNGNYHYADAATNPPDIHGERGMDCIDCHTQAGIMGDGNIYGHMDQATKITCRTCHGSIDQPGTLIDADNKPLSHITKPENGRNDGQVILKAKITGKQHIVPQVVDFIDPTHPKFNPRAAAAMDGNHLKTEGGLACYACHSAWMPNCFGCHFEHDQRQSGKNLLTGEVEAWKASTNNKMFVSLRHFAMGLNGKQKVSPFVVGCHPIADVTKADGKKLLDFVMPATAAGKSGLAHNPSHSHTIRGKGEVRSCAECHRSPPSLGLGTGHYTFARQRAFLVTSSGVLVYHRWHDPANPSLVETLSRSAAPQSIAMQPNIITGETDYLYVAFGSAGVAIYDLRNILSTDPVAVISDVNAIEVSRPNRYLYVIDQGVGVKVYDTLDPSQPQLIATVAIPTAQRLVLWGVDLFVAAGNSGLVIVDVAERAAPKISATLAGMNAADVSLYAHFQKGNAFAARAYVADPDFGVRIVDLLPNFSQARLLSGIAIDGGAHGLDTYTRYKVATDSLPSREHDYLYVAAANDGLMVFDITAPDHIATTPVSIVSAVQLKGSAMDVDVVSHPAPPGMDDYAYIATSSGLALVKVGEDQVISPATPVLTTTLTAATASRIAVEVQALDRFVDELGNELKENSHPGAGPFSREQIVRILRADIGDF